MDTTQGKPVYNPRSDAPLVTEKMWDTARRRLAANPRRDVTTLALRHAVDETETLRSQRDNARELLRLIHAEVERDNCMSLTTMQLIERELEL